MKDDGGLLMIEPSGAVSAEPLIDELTRKMVAAWRKRRESDYMFKGFHVCRCGATSGNREQWIKVGDGELVTNSLCIHYLAFHRKDIPEEELLKVASLAFGEAEPSEQELARSRH